MRRLFYEVTQPRNQMKHKLLTASLLALILSSCATPTPYQSYAKAGGYKSDQIAPNEYKVTFHGNGYSTREQTYSYALLRSAEITKEHGYKYFKVKKAKDLSGSTTHYNGSITTVNYGYINSSPVTATVFRPNTELLIQCYLNRPSGGKREGVYYADAIIQKLTPTTNG